MSVFYVAALARNREGEIFATVPDRHTASLRTGMHTFPLPLPTPVTPRALFSKRVLGPLVTPAAAFWVEPFAGTVWMVPQNWHRHTPPANASSMLRTLLQLVQVI